MEAGPPRAQADDVVAAKRRLRRRLLASRRDRAAGGPAAAARVAADLAERVEPLRALLDGRPDGPVAAYAALPGEPDPVDLLRALGRPVLLPVLLADADLAWRDPAGPPGAGDDPSPPDAVLGCALVLVPALAVADDGSRLGRGGGSYDRVLTRLHVARAGAPPRRAGPCTVAVVHDDEVLDRLPVEPHDRCVDAVLTPERGLRLLPTPRHAVPSPA